MKCNMNSFYRAASLAAVFWTTVSMSAYTPHETGSRTTASGSKAKEGYTCAANFVPLGSVLIYNGHRYVVQDRMNPKYNRHVDIFMESYKKAIEFGRKEAKVQVLTEKDIQKMGHINKKESKKQDNKKPKRQSPVIENKNNDSTTTASQAPQAVQSSHTSYPSNAHQANPHKPSAPSILKPQAKP